MPTSRTVPVAIDTRVWSDVAQFFPEGGHHRTIAANAECRRIVVLLIFTALRDSNCHFSFNQAVLDRMSVVGCEKRKKLVSFFDKSRFFTIARNHEAGRNSIIRKLSGAKVERVLSGQHNCFGCDVGMAAHFQNRWRYAGTVEVVHLSVEWLQEYDRSFRQACSLLFPEQWRWVPCIESSVAQCVISTPTWDECFDVARLSRRLSGMSPEAKADLYQRSWDVWRQNPLLYLSRTAGRCYYPLTNQPKILRRQHLKFDCNGQIEASAEVDMSATYWVLLTSMLDSSRCRAQLIRDLTDGLFYQKLNREIGSSFTDTQELKAAVQKDCLFGRQDFGKTLLFSAMERLYPDLARLIRHKRTHHSVSWLSDVLTNAEASFFIDKLLPFIVDADVPALPVHDAVIVPASRAKEVESWSRDLASEHFGFCPKFKTQIGTA